MVAQNPNNILDCIERLKFLRELENPMERGEFTDVFMPKTPILILRERYNLLIPVFRAG
jgi:hypothetical protein